MTVEIEANIHQQAITQPKPSLAMSKIERSWDDLSKIITEGRVHELGRKEHIQSEMVRHTTWVKENFASMKDYILYKMFSFTLVGEDVQNSNSSSSNGSDCISSSSGSGESAEIVKKRVIIPEKIEQKIVFIPNDFPYNCESNVKHWVLWCLQPLTYEDAKQYISEHQNITFGEDFIFFINPVYLQSIKDIFHYHVFIKVK